MKLHARNTALLAGAETPEEIDAVAEKLAEKGDFTLEHAKKVVEELRGGNG
jgi:polyhydroxyalkanoate synthesis regulator phasin